MPADPHNMPSIVYSLPWLSISVGIPFFDSPSTHYSSWSVSMLLLFCSAYSIFNQDFRELPGTLNADRLDRDIRAGQFWFTCLTAHIKYIYKKCTGNLIIFRSFTKIFSDLLKFFHRSEFLFATLFNRLTKAPTPPTPHKLLPPIPHFHSYPSKIMFFWLIKLKGWV